MKQITGNKKFYTLGFFFFGGGGLVSCLKAQPMERWLNSRAAKPFYCHKTLPAKACQLFLQLRVNQSHSAIYPIWPHMEWNYIQTNAQSYISTYLRLGSSQWLSAKVFM